MTEVHFLLIRLSSAVLLRMKEDRVHLLLVAPFWPSQVWFSDLLSLLEGFSWEIPVRPDAFLRHGVL